MNLSSFEKRQLRALFGVMLPGGCNVLPLGANDVKAVDRLEALHALLPARTAFGMHGAIWILALAPIWRAMGLCTFAGLAGEKGLALLEGLLTSRFYYLRQLVFLMREMACMAYAIDPRVRDVLQPPGRGNREGRS